MSLEFSKVVKIGLNGKRLTELFPNTQVDPVLEALTNQKRLTRATAFILAAADQRPTQEIALGTLYFSQLVKTCDDIIDRELTNHSSLALYSPESYRERVLKSVVGDSNNAPVGKILGRCLSCFPSIKQEKIQAFFDEMLELHMEVPNRGVPGEYTFRDATEYRQKTSGRLAEVFADLMNSDRGNFTSVGYVWQMMDDALDWQEDLREQSINQFLGMATDTGEIPYLIYIKDRLTRGFLFEWLRLNTILGIKNKNLTETRKIYRKEIDNYLPAIGGNTRMFMETAANLLF